MATSSIRKNIIYWVLFCLPCALIFLITPRGLGQSPDSVGYLMGAYGLLSNHTFLLISNHWPPLYPLVIALVGFATGGDVFFAARALQAILLGCLMLFMIKLLLRAGLSFLWASALSFVIIVSPACIGVTIYAWSELLFTCLLIINAYFLIILIDSSTNYPAKIITLALGATAALAFSTRYIGITIILSNLIALWFCRRRSTLSADLTVYLLTLIVIVSPWLVFYLNLSEPLARRQFAWHPFTLEQALIGLETILFGVAPWHNVLSSHLLKLFAYVVFIFVNCFIFFTTFRASDQYGYQALFRYLFLYIFIYVLFLVVSISFFDVATPLDGRILLPIIIFEVLIIGIYLYFRARPWVIFLGILLFVLLFTHNITELNRIARLSYFNGIELNAKEFLDRPVLKFILSCESNYRIASNSPWELELQLRRRISPLPRPYDMTSGKVNDDFFNEISALQQSFDLIVISKTNANLYSDVIFVGFDIIYSNFDGKVYANKSFSNLCNSI